MARKKTSPPEKIEHSTNVDLQDVQRIDPNPWQPRLTFDPEVIRELATSIRDNGLQQYPAGRYTDAPDGRIQLVFGWQRVLAFRQLAAEDARYVQIPVVIREYTDQEMAFAAMEENRARKDLTPIEEAKAWRRMMDEWPELGPTELGARFGLDKSTISYAVNTLGLPEAVLKAADELGMALGVIRELLCLHSQDHTHEDAMLHVLGKIDLDRKPTRASLHNELHRSFQWPTGRDNTPGEWRTMKGDHWEGPHFDPNDFEKKFKGQIHYIPGTSPVTCNVEEWDKWQQEADDIAKAVQDEHKKTYSVVELANPEREEEEPEPAPVKEEAPEPEGGPPPLDLMKWMYTRSTEEYDMQCAVMSCGLSIEDVWQEGTPELVGGILWEGHEDHPLYQMAAHTIAEHDAKVEELIPPEYEMDDEGEYWFLRPDKSRWLMVYPYPEKEEEDEEAEPAGPPTLTSEQLVEVLPEARAKPSVDKKWLPAEHDHAAQQEALATVLEMLSQDNTMETISRDDPELLALALGSRATIYGPTSLSHNDYKDLASYNLDRLKTPQECLKQCTWGAAMQMNSWPRSASVGDPSKICVNMRCFNAKQRSKTREKTDVGKQGMELDGIIVDLAAKEMVDRGSLDLGEAECKLILAVLAQGYEYGGNSIVYWNKLLAEKMGLPGADTSMRTNDAVEEALKTRSAAELRILVGSMLLERRRFHGKAGDWSAQLKPWLQELELADVQEMASKVQKESAAETVATRKSRPKKATAAAS